MDKKIDNGIEMSDEELMDMVGGAAGFKSPKLPSKKRKEPPITLKYGVVAKYGVQPLYGIKPPDDIRPLYGIMPSE